MFNNFKIFVEPLSNLWQGVGRGGVEREGSREGREQGGAEAGRDWSS